ncbi:hypothetical protein FF011L_49440 [Roseimaritima multifibrata]|uniref:Uncharacterized protein n=1 Tax=Roseimaritima multifibrata TaxID=1930274 RepID=A0A517MMX4_9BACT|nr:hypothetical protein FF011L_49440 [Roseimaritima multifibrata]
MQRYPSHVCDAWMGHSSKVAAKHGQALFAGDGCALEAGIYQDPGLRSPDRWAGGRRCQKKTAVSPTVPSLPLLGPTDRPAHKKTQRFLIRNGWA